MYWLLTISILTVMMGTLAVTSNQAQALNVPLVYASSWLPMMLIITAAVFIFLAQHRASSAISNRCNADLRPSFLPVPLRFGRHLWLILLAIILIAGSALQALVSYQQAESSSIADSMRVQAWVTIEGISDSVYDPDTNSGYRQVAIIEQMSPLIAGLDHKALNKLASEINEKENSLRSDNYKNIKHRVLISAYPKNSSQDKSLTALNELQPGDQLFMSLSVQPLATSQLLANNATGFDSYRWLRARHIDGAATVLAMSDPISKTGAKAKINSTIEWSYLKRLRLHIDQWRWQLRQHFYQDWATKTTAQQQTSAVTLSLLTGDRSLINRDTKDLYQLAGISHLLAISGTHVLFLAIMLAGATILLFDRWWSALYRYLPRWQVRWWVMIGAAFIYALFTGFDVPAARTAWMLLAIGIMRLTLLPITAMRVLLILAVVIAWFDPFVLWQAGYWLSFIAVALLLKYDTALHTSAKDDNKATHIKQSDHKQSERLYAKLWLLSKRIFTLQCWLFIALLPVTLLLFGKVSLWGLVINLFAIGLFGWVIVPLNLLAGLCYLFSPTIADSVWAMVNAIVRNLHELITWLTSLPSLQSAWLFTPITTSMLLISLFLLLPWLLPRGLLSRWLVLPPLSLLVMTVYANQHALTLTPTLYILPTSDRYISAVLLQYPINKKVQNTKDTVVAADSMSWLILADHRPQGVRTMPTSLHPDKLSATIEQQLRTLSVQRLEGIIVQTSSASLSGSFSTNKNLAIKSLASKNQPAKSITALDEPSAALLPMTVAQLSQRLPTNHYWQAGRYERWSTFKTHLLQSQASANVASISPQNCEQGKFWQATDGSLTLQATTGWPKIEDTSVWDCTLAIDSEQPIRVVHYNATDPLSPKVLSSKKIAESKPEHSATTTSRIIIDAATHARLWRLWSLLCASDSTAVTTATISNSAKAIINKPIQSTMWLSHSASTVSNEALILQQVERATTYDEQPIEVVLMMAQED